MANINRRSWWWLLSGALLLILSQMRFGLGALAWVAPVPWLHFLRTTPGKSARAIFVAAGMVAFTLATLKIITAPLPVVLAAAYGLPLGLLHCLPYIGWDTLRRRVGETSASLAFPALGVLSEWVLHSLLPLGTWGSMANTQLDQLALLQMVSVTGIAGVTFLMLLAAVTLGRILAGERASVRRMATVVSCAVFMIVAAGQLRTTMATRVGTKTRRVAAVGTDSVVGATQALPSEERLREVERGLVRRTELAAAGGATLVVWTEAATMVRPANEAAWKERLQQLAQRLSIDLTAAYVVLLEESPIRYENKYLFLRADGTIHHSYLKHEPVPGEPTVRGKGPLPLVQDDGQGAVSGAICYDYDFPRLAREHSRLDADLVVLPSSDWRGIDPLHTQMAALRAIEGGHSVLRSTRFGLSAGIDPWGRVRAWMSHFDGEERVLIVDLPVKGITTLYGRLGDWLPLVCLLYMLGVIVRVMGRDSTPTSTVVGSRRELDRSVRSISGGS